MSVQMEEASCWKKRKRWDFWVPGGREEKEMERGALRPGFGGRNTNYVRSGMTEWWNSNIGYLMNLEL